MKKAKGEKGGSKPPIDLAEQERWYERFRREYESLPRLNSIPEQERLAEFERRKLIREDLYKLPGAPKQVAPTQLETAQAHLIACWLHRKWEPSDLQEFYVWWTKHEFSPEFKPKFKSEELDRLANNMLLHVDGSVKRNCVKPKKSTTSDEARVKLESAFVAHHEFDSGRVGNTTPIGCRELARKAKVSAANSSRFFEKWFGGWGDYRADANKGQVKLTVALTQIVEIPMSRSLPDNYDPIDTRNDPIDT